MVHQPPAIKWRAVIAGTALAILVSLVMGIAASAASAPIIGSAAGPVGIAAGAFLAGRWAGSAGLLQGGMVAAGWILALAAAEIGAAPAADPLADLALTLLADVGRLALGGALGWAGAAGAASRDGG